MISFNPIVSSTKTECIVYLEEYEHSYDGNVEALYVDFRQEKDMILYNQATGSNINPNATFIELSNLKTTKRLRRGCYYKLNLDLLKNFQQEEKSQQEDSYLIGAMYDLADMPIPTNDQEELLQAHQTLDPKEMSMANMPFEEIEGGLFGNIENENLSLFVKNVGQANWNELQSNDAIKVLYDAGAELRASMADVNAIINSRKKDLIESKPVLVISHWDMDHIHCLKAMSVCDIKNYFSKIVCPDKLRSQTSTAILIKLQNALGDGNVFCLPLPERDKGIMHLWKEEGCISLYQGVSSNQPNYCGLVMFVRGRNKSANYTGDCRLSQADDVYSKEIAKLKTKEHVLIAPHHGGDCGHQYRIYSTPCYMIAISVGANNRYGHPNGEMRKYLGTLGPVKQTDAGGGVDITETL